MNSRKLRSIVTNLSLDTMVVIAQLSASLATLGLLGFAIYLIIKKEW